MSRQPITSGGIIVILVLCACVAVVALKPTRTADIPNRQDQAEAGPRQEISESEREQADARLVRQLLDEDLGDRRFSFPTIVNATADREVIPLDRSRESHQRVTDAIEAALDEATSELSQPDSPIRKLRRINEGSRFFEEALMEKLNAVDGLTCEVPTNREGTHQRSGYPDLRLVDEKSGDVFYLDPKLVEQSSWKSSFRTFYFEPKIRTLKINDHAVHLLVGIGHDGKNGEWTFNEWKIVDLSDLTVRLKAEFQASNADLYRVEEED